MKVINFFGGPGCGKSTMAAGLFFFMKKRGDNVEYVFEQAKNFTWEKRLKTLECQPYVFAKQLRDIWRLKGQVDYVICDSPLFLSMVYAKLGKEIWPGSFYHFIYDQFSAFDNINFLLDRKHTFCKIGRNQDEEEASKIHSTIKNGLDVYNIPYHKITTLDEIYEYI